MAELMDRRMGRRRSEIGGLAVCGIEDIELVVAGGLSTVTTSIGMAGALVRDVVCGGGA